ncbi:MAG TPA: trigger factor [Candidatus Limnocylindrales bacterium]|nr:trigger factor [Candidatus Limnocylindrales bacterium]
MEEIQSTVEESGPAARTLKVSVSPQHVRGRFDQAYRRLQSRAQLKGFRKGKAPRPMLEKVYGEEVEREVLTELIEEGCAQSIREHSLDIVSQPRLLKHEYEGEGGLSFEASVEVRPDVRLGRYQGLPADLLIVAVEDKHVDAQLELLRQRMAVLQTESDREMVQNGDVVVFDMYGFDGDEPVPGTSGEDLALEVGSGRFPEDFEKQLVGVRRGERTSLVVAFPEDHGDEKLRGRTIRFDVTVKEVKTKVLPPVDDSLALEAGLEGIETLEALRERIRQDLRDRARRDGERRMHSALLSALVDAHDFELPKALLHQTIHGYMHEMGVEAHGDDPRAEELHKALEPRAQRELKAQFILDAIAAAEGIEVTQDEMETRVRAQMVQAGRRADELRKHYSRPGAVAELRRGLMREKAAQKVFESATVQEREVDESQVADHA